MDEAKPIIEIHYFGELPRVVLPPGLEAEIQFIDGEEEDMRILTFEGVSIYTTYRKEVMFSEYWFATESGLDSEDERAFDVRDLPEVPEVEAINIRESFPDGDHVSIVWAIKQGWITAESINIPETT